MIKVGEHRDTFDRSTLAMASFHPFKDEWYVVATEKEQWYFLAFVDKVATEVCACDPEEAHIRFSKAIGVSYEA